MNHPFALGVTVTREEVAAVIGGATRGGIEPSRTSSNIALYSDPEAGEKNGYGFDGWSTEESGVFYFTGDGRNGDQVIRKRNKSVLEHERAGRILRLFAAPPAQSRGPKLHRYVGSFCVDAERPFRREDAPGADGILRSVIVFRLIAIDAVRTDEPQLAFVLDPKVTVEGVPPEVVDVTDFTRRSGPQSVASRDEAVLERDFRAYLESRGGYPVRKQIRIPGHARALVTDTFDRASNTLYEAKGTATRESIRMAIGQLLDYRRFISPEPACAILLQVRPAQDLVDLIHASGFSLVHRDEVGFNWAVG